MAPELVQELERGLRNIPATLTKADLHAIITQPAHSAGAWLEQGLADRIIADILVSVPDAPEVHRQAPATVLPLLELTLSQLWERRHDGCLTHDAYQRLGGIAGSLTTWCDSAVSQLPEEDRGTAWRILTSLVRPADEKHHIPAVRQQLPVRVLLDRATSFGSENLIGPLHSTAMSQAAQEVLASLVRHRIVTTHVLHAPGDPEDVLGEPVAELVHDALIRDWRSLREWVAHDHQFQDWLRRADEQRTRWTQTGNGDDLLHGTELAEGLDWHRRRTLPRDVATFLATSQQRQQARIRRSRRLTTS